MALAAYLTNPVKKGVSMATSHYNTVTFVDYSNEKSSVTVLNGSITALTIAAFLTQFGALKTALEGITKGRIVGSF